MVQTSQTYGHEMPIKLCAVFRPSLHARGTYRWHGSGRHASRKLHPKERRSRYQARIRHKTVLGDTLSDKALEKFEMWGGVECTVNRVRGNYFEQLKRSTHESRISDLDRFAEFGITALRQPVLWERVAPRGLAQADWGWSDLWLRRLRELKIRPIVGLLHHGSGPLHTNLLDNKFPEKLARYAAAVASRYPWVRDYTPVNEPLTTARFSALYGHWYPHAQDERSFVRALFHQCKGVVLAMRAIRQVNPAARLVQTDDLGKTFSTPQLRYQADFENERRWVTFDLLCGRIDHQHPLWSYFMWAGAAEEELAWFSENPTPPDVLGFNYYLTSERYLDDDLGSYPTHLHGGNGRDRYVDVEAARLRSEGISGAGKLLREAWERFALPMAITECHNGCTREEQLRWFVEVWNDCKALKLAGVDVRAVTAWSLLGSFDWNSLLTREHDLYESGVFDVRSPLPRPTAIAALVKELATGEKPSHPLLDVPGWWNRPERFVHGIAVKDSGSKVKVDGARAMSELRLGAGVSPRVRPLLITGGTGTLGAAFARACARRGIPYRLTLRSEMDVADSASVAAELKASNPWAVINAAGYVRVDEAANNIAQCMRENATGAIVLAAECARRNMQLVTFSSDLVFDGSQQRPYLESDRPNPLNVYGRSKLLAEAGVLHSLPAALVVRTSAFFGPLDKYNFVTIALRELASGSRFVAPSDNLITATYVPDLVDRTLDLMIDGECGIWHLANSGALSWYQLAKCAAEMAGISIEHLIPCQSADLQLAAARPRFSALESEKAWVMPALETALDRYIAEREEQTSTLESALESEAA